MADRFDASLDLLPADGPDVDPDDALAAALDELSAAEVGNVLQPLGRGWAFEFLAGEFVMRGQSPADVRGTENLRYWIEKTIRTARFAHAAYSDEYGIDYTPVIGSAPSAGLIGQYTTAVADALLVHDRISEVTDFKVTSDPSSDVLEVGFTVVVDEGDERTELEIDPLPIGAG